MVTLSDKIRHVYFVGIGGIGMSALARYFRQKGYEVAGYDRTLSVLTAHLQKEGIAVNDRDEEGQIPASYRNPDDTLVVYTPAVPADCRQLDWFRKAGFSLYKRSEVLGMLSRIGKAL